MIPFFIKGFKLIRSARGNLNLIYDSITHSLYSVDRLVFEIFKDYLKQDNSENIYTNYSGKADFKKIKNILKEINFILSTSNIIANKGINTFNFIKDRCLKSGKFTLMVSQDCNLRCKYCYGGESGRYKTSGERMSREVAIKSIDLLLKYARNAKHYHLGFFGGEPMTNFELIKEIIDYCEHVEKKFEKRFTFSMTTNGTLLTEENVKYLRTKNVGIMISVDGPAHIHNENRIYRNGKGSYQDTMKGLEILKKYQKTIIVRATVTKEYFEKLEEIIKFFDSIGVTRVLFATVSGYEGINPEYKLKINDYRIANHNMLRMFKRILNEIMEGRDPLFLPFIAIMQKIHSKGKSILGCGIFRGSSSISADGKLYPCHRFVGLKGFEFGDVWNGIDINQLKKICDSLDEATEECNYCWAKYLCARSCVREIAKESGYFTSFRKGYCDLIRKTIEKILVFYTLLKEKKPEILEKWSNQGRI